MSKVVIAGGGTGGHVYPALSIGQALVEQGVTKNDILFLGSNHSIEKKVIPASGFKLKTLSGRGLNRGEWLKNIAHAAAIILSCIRVFFSFLISRPKVVIGVGGYASMPAIFGASLLRIPTYVHEQNSVVTRSNKLAMSFGAKLLTSWPDTEGEGKNFEYVGIPLRSDITTALKTREQYVTKQHNKKVLVMCGSLGSVVINNVVIEMVQNNKIDFQLVHIAGKNDYKRVSNIYSKLDKDIECYEYDENVIDTMAKSDLVIGRAGAGTCAELETLSLNSVLIPLPSAPGNHQYKNAKSLMNMKLATVIKQKDLNSETLINSINQMLATDTSVPTNTFHLDAANRIAELVNQTWTKEN